MGSVNVVKTIKAPAKETVRKEDIARVTLKKAAYTMKARRSLWRPERGGIIYIQSLKRGKPLS